MPSVLRNIIAPFFMLIGLAPMQAQNLEAYFEYEFSSQQPSTVFFYNLSQGDPEGATWTFGDGDYFSGLADTVQHTFPETKFYQVCLTIWDANGTSKEYCEDVFVGPEDVICDYTDCVFPGDADGDGQANFYDMLHMGLGLGTAGPARPDATLEWYGQPAPDWGLLSAAEVDYKHLDADGNGLIEAADMEAIYVNNQSIPKQPQVSDNDGPTVFLDFHQDSIYLQDYFGQDTIHLVADIYLGQADDTFEALHGIGFYIDYEEELFNEYDVEISYNSDAFTGKVHQDVAVGWKDQKASSQVDFGLTRMSGQSISGGGRVGQARFIIVSDIIEARTVKDEVGVEFPLRGLKALDANGKLIFANVTKFPATVRFFEGSVTSTVSPALARRIVTFPNPVADVVRIYAEDLDIESMRLFNNLGELVYDASSVENRQPLLDLSHLPAGMYYLHLHTSEGFAVKQLFRR